MSVKRQRITRDRSATFDISAPYLSEGRTNLPLAATKNMWVTLKVNAEGGENALHTHMDEDHFFLVLEGRVTFHDETGAETELGPYQGIMIPRGAYYRYLNSGGENLFLLRCGCRTENPEGLSRLGPDGEALVGGSRENKHVEGVPIPGKIFGLSPSD